MGCLVPRLPPVASPPFTSCATRRLRSCSLSSSSEEDFIGFFSFFFGRTGDESESEPEIWALEAEGSGETRRGLSRFVLSFSDFPTGRDGCDGPATGDFLPGDAELSPSDSVAESIGTGGVRSFLGSSGAIFAFSEVSFRG